MNSHQFSKVYFLGAGNSTNATIAFYDVYTQLRENGIEFEIIDMPGHGEQTKEDITSIDEWSEYVHAQISKCQVENIFIVGVSLAGHIAFRVMDLFRKYPSNSKIYPIIQGSPPADLSKVYSKDIPQYIPITDLAKEALGYLAADKMTKEQATVFVKCQFPAEWGNTLAEKCILDSFISSAQETRFRKPFVESLFGSKFDEMKALVEWTQSPLLIIHGKYDAAVNPAYLDIIPKNKLFEGKYHVIDGAHQLAPTKPKELTTLILTYMANMLL